GPALHWLDRFARCYEEAGLALPFAQVREAFDHATHCAYTDTRVAQMGLQALIAYHGAPQFERLAVAHPAPAARGRAAVVRASRGALADSRAVLERLRRHVALGVVSNFYGNVGRILEEERLAPLLTTVVDSNCVGVSKPDPAIFALAVR